MNKKWYVLIGIIAVGIPLWAIIRELPGKNPAEIDHKKFLAECIYLIRKKTVAHQDVVQTDFGAEIVSLKPVQIEIERDFVLVHLRNRQGMVCRWEKIPQVWKVASVGDTSTEIYCVGNTIPEFIPEGESAAVPPEIKK